MSAWLPGSGKSGHNRRLHQVPHLDGPMSMLLLRCMLRAAGAAWLGAVVPSRSLVLPSVGPSSCSAMRSTRRPRPVAGTLRLRAVEMVRRGRACSACAARSSWPRLPIECRRSAKGQAAGLGEGSSATAGGSWKPTVRLPTRDREEEPWPELGEGSSEGGDAEAKALSAAKGDRSPAMVLREHRKTALAALQSQLQRPAALATLAACGRSNFPCPPPPHRPLCAQAGRLARPLVCTRRLKTSSQVTRVACVRGPCRAIGRGMTRCHREKSIRPGLQPRRKCWRENRFM